jgi:hypothetical protein
MLLSVVLVLLDPGFHFGILLKACQGTDAIKTSSCFNA